MSKYYTLSPSQKTEISDRERELIKAVVEICDAQYTTYSLMIGKLGYKFQGHRRDDNADMIGFISRQNFLKTNGNCFWSDLSYKPAPGYSYGTDLPFEFGM